MSGGALPVLMRGPFLAMSQLGQRTKPPAWTGNESLENGLLLRYNPLLRDDGGMDGNLAS